jgi:DNA mismatch endonuclease (patch repair protein)
MPDMFTKEKRSEIMSKIRSKGTRIELRMKKALEDRGIGFEYQPKMFGKPDFLISPNIVVFCDSSFWHGRDWNRLRTHLSRPYWYDHIRRNRKRDKLVAATLKEKGYTVIRFWDYQLEKEIEKCVGRIERAMHFATGGS